MSNNPVPAGLPFKIHDLKIDTNWFWLVAGGNKNFEIRLNDRGYRPTDYLILREWVAPASCDPDPTRYPDGVYTGRWAFVAVEHVYENLPGMQEGYVLLVLKMIESRTIVHPERD